MDVKIVLLRMSASRTKGVDAQNCKSAQTVLTTLPLFQPPCFSFFGLDILDARVAIEHIDGTVSDRIALCLLMSVLAPYKRLRSASIHGAFCNVVGNRTLHPMSNRCTGCVSDLPEGKTPQSQLGSTAVHLDSMTLSIV